MEERVDYSERERETERETIFLEMTHSEKTTRMGASLTLILEYLNLKFSTHNFHGKIVFVTYLPTYRYVKLLCLRLLLP